jgi:nucleotide-binding universal stress UspA family protein
VPALTLRSILSPVDFSEPSRHALRWAGEFAVRFQTRLTVLNVVDPLLAEAAKIRFGQDLAKMDTEPALREFVAATWPDGTAPSVQTIFKTPSGDPVTVILETAASEAADLIVMGTQGLGGFRKWLLGSTTERLLRRTHLPVLAVPLGEESSGQGVNATVEVGRILAATDFSESSVAAVQYALQLAPPSSAGLVLAHAVEPFSAPPEWQPLAEESTERRVAHARDRLKVLAEQCCGPEGCEAIVSVGRTAEVIGAIAEKRRVQLIVLGLNSDQGPLAPRPGSIAYRVMSSATVPVLVVPALPHRR